MRDENAALPVIGADFTLSCGFFRDGSLPLRPVNNTAGHVDVVCTINVNDTN